MNLKNKPKIDIQQKLISLNGASLRVRLLPLACSVLLSACSGSQHGDLETYVADVKARQQTKIPDLPQVKTYAPFNYAAFDVRDPFLPLLDEEALPGSTDVGNDLKPKTDRKSDPLESFPLDTLAFVGHLEKRGTRWGLVSAPDKSIYKVQIGNYMGKNFGEIIKITETKILLREIIPDGANGWLDREASLALSE